MGWSSIVTLVVRSVYHILYKYISTCVSFPIMIEERKCTNKMGHYMETEMMNPPYN